MATYGVVIQLLAGGLEDASGAPLSGGKVTTYAAGTSTPKATYTNRDKSTTAANPIVLSAYGTSLRFGDGVYRFVITDANDVPIYDWDNLNFTDVSDTITVQYVADTGSGGVHYTVAPSPAISAYTAGQTFVILANQTNTGACDLNVNGLGTKAIKKPNGSDPAAGDIISGSIYMMVYNGTNFRVVAGLPAENGAINDNVLVNGDVTIWQDGTSFSSPASGSYTADQVVNSYDGTIGTFTISRQAFTIGQTDVPGEPEYYIQWAHSAAGTGSTYRCLGWRIEDVRRCAGQEVTVSFYAKADAARIVVCQLKQNFGTGGSPSAAVDTSVIASCSLTTSWQKFTGTVTVPSISGKTLGTGANDYIDCYLAMPLNTTMTIDVADMKMEVGDTATAFKRLSYDENLRKCQYYYWKWGTHSVASDPQVLAVGWCSSTSVARIAIQLPTPMRAVPALTATNMGINGGGYADATFAVVGSDANRTMVELTGTDGTTSLTQHHAAAMGWDPARPTWTVVLSARIS